LKERSYEIVKFENEILYLNCLWNATGTTIRPEWLCRSVMRNFLQRTPYKLVFLSLELFWNRLLKYYTNLKIKLQSNVVLGAHQHVIQFLDFLLLCLPCSQIWLNQANPLMTDCHFWINMRKLEKKHWIDLILIQCISSDFISVHQNSPRSF